VGKGWCTPLREVAHSRERPPSLGEVAPSPLSHTSPLVMVWGYGKGGSPYHNTWPPPSHMWCALSSTWCTLLSWASPSFAINKACSPIVKLDGVGKSCLWLYTIVILSFGIKRLWRSRRCVIHMCGCLMSFVLNLRGNTCLISSFDLLIWSFVGCCHSIG
jgi:hypothetical protein